MKPIRDAEAKIYSEGGLGFEIRWQGIPVEIKLQSLIAAMNEFVSVRPRSVSPRLSLPPLLPLPTAGPVPTPPAYTRAASFSLRCLS